MYKLLEDGWGGGGGVVFDYFVVLLLFWFVKDIPEVLNIYHIYFTLLFTFTMLRSDTVIS